MYQHSHTHSAPAPGRHLRIHRLKRKYLHIYTYRRILYQAIQGSKLALSSLSSCSCSASASNRIYCIRLYQEACSHTLYQAIQACSLSSCPATAPPLPLLLLTQFLPLAPSAEGSSLSSLSFSSPSSLTPSYTLRPHTLVA